MIDLSLLRRGLLAGAAALALLAAGCACTAIGCRDGLNILLDGTYEVGKSYQVDVSTVTTTPETVRIMRCSLLRPSQNEWDLRCSSAHVHTEGGNRIQIRGEEIKNVLVAVSSEGVKLGEQMHEARYSSEEINGPGCGTCTSAVVKVTVP